MIPHHIALSAMVLYLLLLFLIAQYAIKQKQKGKSIVANPYVYALSIAVYVTAWTFYGSIGRAVSNGLEFLAIFLGPSLAMLLGWVLVRKMVRVSKEFGLASVSDFISYRYGRSYTIGAIVTILSLIIVSSYIALQLIAISDSLEILSGQNLVLGFPVSTDVLVAAILGIFVVTFGARQLNPMDRHEGLVAAVAFESLVKLIAFLAAGIYVTYGLFGGYRDIINQFSMISLGNPALSKLTEIDYTSWFTLTLISFFAVLLLPRQFYMIAVENSDESHIKTEMWLFPLFLLLINLFVPAIAWGGLILNTPGAADEFIITIPSIRNQNALALLVFIGGLSAATSMILVSSVTVGTMMLNDLELPYLLKRIGGGRNLPRLLLNMRRLNILLVIALGYIYSNAVAYQSLADIGIVSFLAASQFAPAALGGLYWKRGSREGAMAGLISGTLIWMYTALVPTLAAGGLISMRLITDGPLGIGLLKPTSLLGLQEDIWTNSMFWSLFVNCSLYVLISLSTKPSQAENAIAESFVDVYQGKSEVIPSDKFTINVGTVDELEATLARYLGREKANGLVSSELSRLKTTREKIDARQLLEIWAELMRTLTGPVGPSTARMIVEDRISVKPVVEATEASTPAYDLKSGGIYISPDKAYEVFKDQITHGIEGLCITKLDPEEVRSRWGIRETPIIKLSSEKSGDRYISPNNLPLLYVTIKSFIESSKNSIVLLDSIEHLVRENVGILPQKEVLDFVYQLEMASKRTRLLLPERPQFVHQGLSSDITEVKELIFTLGPLSSYLFKAFSDAMLSGLDEGTKEQVISDVKLAISSGNFFEGARAEGGEGGEGSIEGAESSCDPEMRATIIRDSTGIELDRPLTRREFFVAIRKLGKIIRGYRSGFDMMTSLGALMKSYDRSPYELTLTPGTTYVIEEVKPIKSLGIFSELVNHGMEGLCLSRYNPQILSDRYNIPLGTIVWMTQKSESKYRSVDPTNFPRLSSILSDFLKSANYPVILLEGLGYLITQSNYETVLRFIQSQRDDIALREAILLVHIDPLSLDTKELHRLESEMEQLEI